MMPPRPAVHLTPVDTWMNDPNGLFRRDGRWHAFYQNNPLGSAWGHMSWRHAVSDDLLAWTDLGVAIPERDGTAIFSGSVVDDAGNTSGLAPAGDRGPLVAIYTGNVSTGDPARHGPQTQNLAVSTDDGATWVPYAGNPVLDRDSTDFRDPQVLRHGPTGRWVMVTVEAQDHEVLVHTSADLVHWEHASTYRDDRLDGIWECPDLMPLDTAHPDGAWLLIVSTNPHGPAGGSGTWGVPGTFDGTSFAATAAPQPLDHGPDHYAAVSFWGVDGAPLVMPWASNWDYARHAPTWPWRGTMGLARAVAIETDAEGEGRLVLTPVLPAAPRPLADPVLDPAGVHVLRLDLPPVGAAWELATSGRPELRIERTEQGMLVMRRAESALPALDEDGRPDPSRPVFGVRTSTLPIPVDGERDELVLALDGCVAELLVARRDRPGSPMGPMATMLFFPAQGAWELRRDW